MISPGSMQWVSAWRPCGLQLEEGLQQPRDGDPRPPVKATGTDSVESLCVGAGFSGAESFRRALALWHFSWWGCIFLIFTCTNPLASGVHLRIQAKRDCDRG